MYEKKPRSRVFAPLAETYRKLGMLDEAFKILNKGIKYHPSYTLGYIVLGQCYFDTQNYEMAYSAIRPFISQNLENITLQKLFAKTCINLGYLEEALQTFKYLLLINPKDTYVADQIKLLEDDLLVDKEEEEDLETHNNQSSFDEDEWVQVDFNRALEKQENDLDSSEKNENDLSLWNVEKNNSPLDIFKEEIKSSNLKVNEHNLDDDYYHEDFDNESKEVIGPEENTEEAQVEQVSDGPIITHTLVDLYIKQGHLAKAASILEEILELHPTDKATREKLDELTFKLIEENQNESSVEEDTSYMEKAEGILPDSEDKEDREDSKISRYEILKEVYGRYQDQINLIAQRKLSTL